MHADATGTTSAARARRGAQPPPPRIAGRAQRPRAIASARDICAAKLQPPRRTTISPASVTFHRVSFVASAPAPYSAISPPLPAGQTRTRSSAFHIPNPHPALHVYPACANQTTRPARRAVFVICIGHRPHPCAADGYDGTLSTPELAATHDPPAHSHLPVSTAPRPRHPALPDTTILVRPPAPVRNRFRACTRTRTHAYKHPFTCTTRLPRVARPVRRRRLSPLFPLLSPLSHSHRPAALTPRSRGAVRGRPCHQPPRAHHKPTELAASLRRRAIRVCAARDALCVRPHVDE